MAPIRVLVVGMTATVGGIENFLMAYCGRMDKARVRFDFLTRFADAAYPEKRETIGKTYVIPRRSEDPVGFYEQIHAFFAAHAGEYDVIWDNECMFNDMTPLQLAAEYGIPVRIAHSHNPKNMNVTPRGRAMELLHRTQRRMLGWYANNLWACSEESARWACPAMDMPCAVIPNAIDARAFRYDEAVRREVRAHYGLEGCLVVGQVGRLQYQKNQGFLLEAFARLKQREPRARLVLVGDGPDLTDLEAKAVDLEIAADVLFLGVRDDVPRLMQAFDLFAMPSRFEGLGMAALEAQAAGLPCILSSAVPRAAAVTEDVTFLEAEDPDLWAERMLDVLENPPARRDTFDEIARAGYEIGAAAEKLTERLEYLVAETPAFRRRFLLTALSTARGVPAMNKARIDVAAIAADAGYIPVRLHAGDTAQGDRWKQIRLAARVGWDWTKLFFKLHHGDLLLVQYPYFPVKAAGFVRFALHMIRWKGAKTAALIHDLDSLRLLGGQAARWSDQELLPGFECIVAHNGRMARYLHAQGIAKERLIALEQFDYLTDVPMPRRQLSMEVCIAGNLSRKKSRYLLELPRGKVTWRLFGEGWKGKARRTDIVHCGSYAPEKLPGVLEGSFGLVWDGVSARIPTGHYGAYLMINNPHKLSLYLASGMPVIVWEGSAQAEFVRREGVGLVIGGLNEIQGAIAALTAEEYAVMAENARRIGGVLRQGGMTRAALLKIQ